MSKGIAISLLYLKYTTFVTVNSTGEIIPCAFNKCNNCAAVKYGPDDKSDLK